VREGGREWQTRYIWVSDVVVLSPLFRLMHHGVRIRTKISVIHIVLEDTF
jgi:hypothetical protein